jgi:hypothetical protein
MLSNLALLALLAAAPARAGDWLLDSQRAAAGAPLAGEAVSPPPASDWAPYEPASRLFRGELPPEGWNPFDEEDALGPVALILGPDDPSGALRATLSVRLMDRDSPVFLPAKDAVAAMRRSGPDREAGQVSMLRVGAGLARIFEITRTRRAPDDVGPSVPLELHEYVAVIPRGEAYYVARLVTARENYLDFKEFFVRFLKELKPVGER